MSTALVACALGGPPSTRVIHDKETVCATASTAGAEPLTLTLHAYPGGRVAEALAQKQQGDLLLLSGDLVLDEDGNLPVLWARTLSPSSPEIFVNEAVIVGRLAGEAKPSPSGKSAARSLAVNRYAAGQEVTDWFKVRGFGSCMERLLEAPKGALVQITGVLEQRLNKEGSPYMEVKARTVRIHSKGGGSRGNHAAGTEAAGYDQADFQGGQQPLPTDWS
jgi:single-stranded DNA-binding protein